MRWKNENHGKPKPKQGSTRTVYSFAWFPKRMQDGYTVWLEHYKQVWRLNYVKHRFVKIGDRSIDIGPGLKWQIVKETTHDKVTNEKLRTA